ncbi:MAG: hypothetical protein P8Y18_09015 [Candidatus Bathyarchaeota archaeon]
MHKAPAHKSRILSHAIEVVFKPDNLQILPGKGIQTTTAETASQPADTVNKVPQTGSPLLKSKAQLII